MLRFIPFGEYAPDAPLYHDPATGAAGFTPTATNVVPRDKVASQPYPRVTYAPLAGMAPYSSALTARCQGAFAMTTSSDANVLFAGDATKLYSLTNAATTWNNLSGATYTISADDFWSFVSWGDECIAANFNDAIQAYTVGVSATFANLSVTAPKAKFLAVVRDFLFTGYTQDGTFGLRPQRVWWSAIGDPTSFPTPGSAAAIQVQSDYQDLVGAQGNLTGMVPSACNLDLVLFFEGSIWKVAYVGGTNIFDFSPVEGARGSRAPRSIISEENQIFYYSESGFRRFDGTSTYSIGFNRVDEKIASELAPGFIDRIVVASDPTTKTIVWAYPGLASTNGVPNTFLIYNYEIDAWSSASITVEYLMRAQSFGTTMEGLVTLGYATLEAVPYSLDSEVWAGTSITLAGFDSSHILDYFSGAPLLPLVETPQFVIGDGDNLSTDTRALVINSRPVFSGNSAAAAVSIGTRETFTSNLTYSTPVVSIFNGSCPQRTSGRYLTARLSITNSTQWEQLQGVEVELRPQGRR